MTTRRLDGVQAENRALAQQVAALIAERNTLRAEVSRTKRLAAEQHVVDAERERSARQVHNLLSQNQALTEENQAAREQADDLAAENAALVRQAAVLATEKDAADRRIGDLTQERDEVAQQRESVRTRCKRLTAAVWRWREQAAGEARAAARVRRERDALRQQVAALEADRDQLTGINAWLQQKLRFREKTLRSA